MTFSKGQKIILELICGSDLLGSDLWGSDLSPGIVGLRFVWLRFAGLRFTGAFGATPIKSLLKAIEFTGKEADSGDDTPC